MSRHQGITAKDIALACDVSQATVSYVVNNTEGKRVSEAQRQQILKMAEEVNYGPNSAPQCLRECHPRLYLFLP